MQLVRCSVSAQVAMDGANKPYPTYTIPDPEDYTRWEKEMSELRKVARSEIGSNPDVQPPTAVKGLVMKRGEQPVEMTMSEGLFRQLSVDRKNLLIFNVQKLDAEGNVVVEKKADGKSERKALKE